MGGMMGGVAQPLPVDLRPGDWICNKCSCHNFASKTHCYKCRPRRSVLVASPRPPHTHPREICSPLSS
jgi:hypothetical protein